MRSRTTKLIAAAALVCGGAIATAVGVKIHRYYIVGTDPDGVVHWTTKPEVIYRSPDGKRVRTRVRGGTMAPGESIEQKQRDDEEMDLLRQQGKRELVSVVQRCVNGHWHRPTLFYKYVLSDGRAKTRSEKEPDRPDRDTPEQIEKEFAEVERLRQEGQRELIGVSETVVDGELHRALRYKYVLANGHETTRHEDDLDVTPLTSLLSGDQVQEVWRLRRLKQGEFLGYETREVLGRPFAFGTYRFILAGGTVVTHSVGELTGQEKTELTEVDRAEWQEMLRTNQFEELEVYEEQIEGRMFTFRPMLFVLSDGTELIMSRGTPSQ